MRDMFALVKELYVLSDELYARQFSNNVAYEQYKNTSWEELCERGMDILEELRAG